MPEAPANGSPQLTVVLSTFGNYEGLRRVLDGYERQDAPPGSFEVAVVVDLADPDPAAADAAIGTRPYPLLRPRGRRPGLSANRNAGWEAARAPLVLFTDNDTVPVPVLVSEHLAAHAAHPQRETAVVGHVRWARGVEVTPFMRWLDGGIQFDYGSIRAGHAGWAHLYGANSSVKRTLLEAVGGYDEVRLPYGYEDLDWGYRAREHGLRVLYSPDAIVDHWRTMTVAHWQARAPRLARSEWQFCRLHPDVPPHFWRLFSEAAAAPPCRGRAARLAGIVPRRTPWLGRYVWDRASLAWMQAIAPAFLAAWDQAEADGAVSAATPADAVLAERAGSGD